MCVKIFDTVNTLPKVMDFLVVFWFSPTSNMIIDLICLFSFKSSLQLLLLSYLDVRSLCQVSQTCHVLNNLASDHLLWERILSRDLKTWTLLNYQSYPQIFLDAGADLGTKEM